MRLTLPLLVCFSFACAVFTAGGLIADPTLPPGENPPPTPVTRLADAGTADDHGGADLVVVLDKAVNKVKPSGVTYVDAYRLVKVLTPAGCRDNGVLNWHYDPQSSHVEIRKVSIIRDGQYLPVDLAGLHDLPAPQAAIYWRDRIKTLQLPRLQVGDGIEVISFRKGFTYALLGDGGPGGAAGAQQQQEAFEDTGEDDSRYVPPMPGEYFDIVLFQEEAPIIEKRYVLRLPPDKRLHAEVYNGALYSGTSYDETMNEYSWWGLDLPARVHEPRQPDASDIVPKVVMATAESWEAKSRWFFDVNQDQFEVTPAIQVKVEEILRDAGVAGGDDLAKSEALVHWVAQNIRYSGQTMGEGEGFTLHPGDMIFEQRSGVCKDIAGMLINMMLVAGLDSYAAMTMAGSRIDLVPADQFNHCVTALRLDDGSFVMYDPTWVPFNNDIWSKSETEQHYLIGTSEGETLSRIPYSPPGESPLKVVHEAELDAEGTLQGVLRFDGAGAMDSRLRRIVNGVRRDEIAGRCAQLLAPVSPRVVVEKVEHREADDFSGDMWLRIAYRIPRFAPELDGGFEFTSPLMQVVTSDGNLFPNGGARWDEGRTTDLMLWYTQLLDGSETIKLPKGYDLQDPPESEDVDETYAAFSASADQDGRTLRIAQRAEVRRRQIPPDGYAGFRKAMDAARDWTGQTFRIAKEGK